MLAKTPGSFISNIWLDICHLDIPAVLPPVPDLTRASHVKIFLPTPAPTTGSPLWVNESEMVYWTVWEVEPQNKIGVMVICKQPLPEIH